MSAPQRVLWDDRAPSAVFADSNRYRYILRWPTGAASDSILTCIGANPSKAGQIDEAGNVRSDPTVSRLRGLARELGHGWLWMVNVRAFISTDPKGVPPDPEAIGPFNDEWLGKAVCAADLVLCCWGQLAGWRAPVVLELVRSLGKVPHALALTADGTPRHPRGIPLSARPFPLTEPDRAQLTATMRAERRGHG